MWGLLGPVAWVERAGGYRVQLYVLDGLGHVRGLVGQNSSGAWGWTDRYRYDSWGNLLARAGTTPQPFLWNGAYGYEYVPATGLYHVGAREYDPRTGRWLQRDPIDVTSGDPNLYRYCGNDTINRIDFGGTKVQISACVGEEEKKIIEQHLERLRNSKSIGHLIRALEAAEEVILIETPKSTLVPEYAKAAEEKGAFWTPDGLDDDKDGIRGSTIVYDPSKTLWIKCPGCDPIYEPPDVVLAHELGHAYGLEDPPPDLWDRATGACIDTFENPYRRERGLPERPCYGRLTPAPKPAPSQPKPKSAPNKRERKR